MTGRGTGPRFTASRAEREGRLSGVRSRSPRQERETRTGFPWLATGPTSNIPCMPDLCVFCNASSENIFHPGKLVYGLWDAFPVSTGHALIVTRRHIASWFDATDEERAELVAATDIARAAIEERRGPGDPAHGYNIGVNVGGAAGQTVGHLHMHVIPRSDGDVTDPRGGVRNVIPQRGNYLRELEGADAVHEIPDTWQTESVRTVDRPAVVGGPDGPLLPHLKRHLDEASRADLVVAFVLESGVRDLEQALRGFLLRGGQLRLVTGDYMGVTDPGALRLLLDLASFVNAETEESEEAGAVDSAARTPRGTVELRVFESAAGSFHPKAYIFHFDRGNEGVRRSVAYVGSSNLSRTALGDGVEWNYRLIMGRDRQGFGEVLSSFEGVFEHENTRALTELWIEEYAKRRPDRNRAAVDTPVEPAPPVPEPHPVQREALDALHESREAGNRAGLVVMATGLGKTWLAAFDVAQLKSRRVLFVAHRDEILRQALATFRRILPEARLGLYTGQEQAPDADVLFASIQCLGRPNHLTRFARSAFDYVVVDEFHHAAAATYRRLIDHFDPGFLLGLTATPERTDGGDLLGLCGENLVYRCDLFEALRRVPDRLVPFHYFGVPDSVDYSNIPWRNRRFDVEELTKEVATNERAQNAFEQWQERGGSRTLGFCCSIAHADFMADFFKARGVSAVAIHSGDTSAPRAASLEQLASGELEVVFAIDILNEGVDIPEVDTVLMLRPTESRIVFLQQLGRGLRASEGKTHLTVVDYIGNHRSFKLKPEVLLQLDPGDAPLRQALLTLRSGTVEPLGLPEGCEVTYELEAIRLLEEQLRPPNAANVVRDWYEDFEERTGRRPLALDALHESRNPRSVRASHGSWLRFVDAQGGLDANASQLVKGPDLAGAFFEELERTKMTRSFKMVLLLAMLRQDRLPGTTSVDELASSFVLLAERSERIRKEVTVDLSDRRAVRAYLVDNPIKAWCRPKGQRTYFDYRDGQFTALFDVAPELREQFCMLARELATWRLAAHFGADRTGIDAGWRIICKVIQTRGTPFLKLPGRERHPEIPEGNLDVLANGLPHVADFASIAVNVIEERVGAGNTLKTILRDWFGEEAGHPGRLDFVSFTNTGDGWTLEPLGPGEASRPTVEHAVERGVDSIVSDPDGHELDAAFHLERTEGQLSLVYRSGGGTAGTPQAVNREYAPGLETLLGRIATRELIIEAIVLDTKTTQDLPFDDRLLRLRGDREYPLNPATESNLDDLRRAISAAQGNNPNRTIRILLSGADGADLTDLSNKFAGVTSGPHPPVSG